jgi:hypothetical protein
MLKGITREIRGKIAPISLNRDDVFITCASFEDRTTAAVEKFDERYCVTDAVIFKYDEKNRTNLRDLNFEKLSSILREHSTHLFPIICDHHDPLDGIYKFVNLCKRAPIELKNRNVTIDITTFTKQYLLVLFKSIEKEEPRSVRLIYTEPEDYAVKWKKPLSYGLIDIVTVPTYGGNFYSDKENLLVLLLGYEGNRAYATWEKQSPHRTIVLVGKPSFKESWDGRVEEFNKALLLKLPKESVHYIPTLNPFEVARCLDDLIEEYKHDFNIAISTLGPKPQVVGSYLSLRKHPYVQAIYAIPKSHEEEYFSKKVGRTWEYR